MIKLSSLNSDNEFKKLLKLRKIHNNSFTIYFGKIYTDKKNKDFKISIVAKKKIGNAVKRNRIKRRLRNITNDAMKKLLPKLNYSYLIIAKETILKNEYLDLKKIMFTEFNKIK